MELPSLQDVHVVVVGDVMLDRYWSGDTRRISQEAPVPVIDVTAVDDRPGGAANVALNVVSLGARCTLLGVIGDDPAGAALEETLTAAGVNCDLVTLADWPTILKLRVVSRKQQLLRTDFETPIPESAAAALADTLSSRLDSATVLVLQDYDKGTITNPQPLIDAARRAGVPVVVDPKEKPFARYAGADLLKPNETEFRDALGPWQDDAELVALAIAACAASGFGALVVTRGAEGSTVVTASGAHLHLPALPVDVFDVTGAGDTAAAALAVTRSLGWLPEACAQVANVAAGLAVAKTGTATVSGPELALALGASIHVDRGVLTREQLLDAITRARSAGQRIVFTNGCFDILHAGHVAYLEEARALGDRLIVAVNDDASVARLKGAGRPVNTLEARLKVLAGLAAVDWLVPFAEDTPEALLELVRPDVLVKGGDYTPAQVVGADLVTALGGKVEVLSLVKDASTTALLERLQSP